MKDWLLRLEPRERWALYGIAALVLVVAIVFAFYIPDAGDRARLRSSVQQQGEVLEWLVRASAEVRRLRAEHGQGPEMLGGESLFALVDRSARASAISRAVKRLEPQGDRAVRLWFEEARFDQTIGWLGRLSAQYNVRPTAVSLQRQAQPGRVSGRVTLEVPAG